MHTMTHHACDCVVQVEGQPLDMKAGPRHVARIQLKGTRIASAAMDTHGGYVACTTPAGTRVYRLSTGGAGSGSAAGSFSVQRLRLADPSFEEGAVAVALAFNMLVVAHCDGSLAACLLPGGELLQRRSASSAPSIAPAAATTTPGGIVIALFHKGVLARTASLCCKSWFPLPVSCALGTLCVHAALHCSLQEGRGLRVCRMYVHAQTMTQF